MGPYDYLQMSVVTDDEDVWGRHCGQIVELVERVQTHADGRYGWVIGTDVNGIDSNRSRGALRADDLSLRDRHAVIAELQPRDAVRWSPPLLSVGATRRGRYPYEASWSVFASDIAEEAYCEVVASQVEQLLLETSFVAGFAGPSPAPSSGTPNSPFFAAMKIDSRAVDLAGSLAGVHWLNLIPAGLLNDQTREQLRESGAEVTVGPGLTAVRLCPTPSEITDEYVAQAMAILDSSTHGDGRALSSDWWRLSYRWAWE